MVGPSTSAPKLTPVGSRRSRPRSGLARGLVAGAIGLVGSLEAIYRAALYVFAAEGVVPEPFGGPDLEDIWEVK